MIKISGSRFISEQEFNRLASLHGSTIPSCGSVFIPLGRDVIFNNQELKQKTINTGVWHAQDSSTMTYEVARQDGNTIDIDRYFISTLSGSTATISKPIKNFPEHHSERLPNWYKSNEENKND